MPSENPSQTLLDGMMQALSTPPEPRMVRGPEECARLLRLRNAGKAKQARLLLQNRAKAIVPVLDEPARTQEQTRQTPQRIETPALFVRCAAQKTGQAPIHLDGVGPDARSERICC